MGVMSAAPLVAHKSILQLAQETRRFFRDEGQHDLAAFVDHFIDGYITLRDETFGDALLGALSWAMARYREDARKSALPDPASITPAEIARIDEQAEQDAWERSLDRNAEDC